MDSKPPRYHNTIDLCIFLLLSTTSRSSSGRPIWSANSLEQGREQTQIRFGQTSPWFMGPNSEPDNGAFNHPSYYPFFIFSIYKAFHFLVSNLS
ncbi:hypothetical protein RND81_10G047500 [Saponaria officinalis]|uniref:Uncharacterized protein n=1 Tax=Saponaria officinalis TaxID=3572 RepID=A0AAW1HYF4_SAPOF